MPEKKKLGPPFLPDGVAQDIRFTLRVDAKKAAEIRAGAADSGENLADFVRRMVNVGLAIEGLINKQPKTGSL